MAAAYFGRENPVGRRLTMGEGAEQPQRRSDRRRPRLGLPTSPGRAASRRLRALHADTGDPDGEQPLCRDANGGRGIDR